MNTDSGPSGKPPSVETLEYAGKNGGNVVFADSLASWLVNVPLKLTASYLWDALGLPLTAFNDSRRKGSLRTVTDVDLRSYQYAEIGLLDDKGNPGELPIAKLVEKQLPARSREIVAEELK